MRTSWIFKFCLLFVSVVFLQSSYAQDSIRWGLPERAKMRIGKAPVTEIAYSPDGWRIAAATRKDIWMYDARSGVALKLLTGHTDSVLTVAFSPSGNTLASGGADGTVRGWFVRSGRLFETITGHEGPVRSVRFSPDGSTLASAGEDKLIRLWDGWNVELKGTLEGHLGSVDTVAFSPDGLTLASGSRDGAVMLWDVQTGKKLRTLEGHEQPVSSVAFSPDGRTLASAGRPQSVDPRLSRDGRIKLWDTRTGEQVRTLEGHSHTVGCVAFSPNGDLLASGGGWYDDTVRMWNTRTGEEDRILEGHIGGVNSIAFSPDGVKLASASSGSIRMWDTGTGEHLRTLVHGVAGCAFAPDGKTLAVGGAEAIEIWDARSGEKLRTLPGLTGSVLAFSPDGTTLAIRGIHDYTIILLCDVRSGEVLQTFEAHTDHVVSAAFSPDGKVFASGWPHKGNSLLRLWDAHTGEPLHVISFDEDFVRAVAFSPDGRTVYTGGWHSGIRIWDVHTGELLHTLVGGAGELSPITSIVFSPDGTRFASGSGDLTVHVWDTRTREMLHTLTGHGSSNAVKALSFSSDGEILATGGDDTIRLWDVRTGALLWKFEGHASSVESVEFAADGNMLASWSWYGTVLLWDFKLGTVWGDVKRTRVVVGRTGRFSEPAPTAAVLMPEETTLLPNFPNPFNPETWIPYQLKRSAEVTLEVYDLNGQTVRTLAVGHQPAGVYQSRERAAYWDGRNEMGETVANGVYFYTLTAGKFTATRKMLVGK